MVRALSELGKTVVWAVGVGGVVAVGWRAITLLIKGNHPFTLSYKDMVLTVQPTSKIEPPSIVPLDSPYAAVVASAKDQAGVLNSNIDGQLSTADDPELPAVQGGKPLPSDYIYLTHTSFLRPDKQAEFTSLTKVQLPHYDIRIKTESYYKDAMSRISYVEYVLHESFPEPIQRRYEKSDGFELKEIANGEFVLAAKIYLKDFRDPLILQRYITLWPSGPRI